MFLRDRAYEAYHLGKFMLSQKKGEFGCIVISVDFELIDEHLFKKEVDGFRSLVRFSHDSDLPMTFAVVGKIIEKDPSYVSQIKSANGRNEIASHSYSHKFFDEIGREDAEREVRKSVEILNKNDINPASFVFPRNAVNYLNLLPKYRFKCYRSFFKGRHMLAYPRKIHGLWDIPQSLFLYSKRDSGMLVKMAEIARRKKLVFHIWCHPFNWGDYGKPYDEMTRTLKPLINYSKRTGLEFKTMVEVANICEQQ